MCLAIPGKIVSVSEAPIAEESALGRTGRVSFGGIVKQVNLSCVPDAGVGDYVIVHVGLAISKLDEEEAQQTLEYLRIMGELAAEELPPRGAGQDDASGEPSAAGAPPR